jgi:hypothetical protein
VPSLSASFSVNSAAPDSSTLTTSSFTPDVDDVIVVKAVTESSSQTMNTPTDTQGNTYTLRASDATANHCWAGLWTAIVGSATSMTVSVSRSFSGQHSITVEDWTHAALDTTPATNGTKTGTGAPTSTLTTTQANSAASWCCGDWSANDPSGRVYNTTSATPTEDGLHDTSGDPTNQYVAYYAWQPADSVSSQTLGLTAPGSQTWTLLGVEILHVASGGGGAPDQNQFGHFPWQ